jgi:hypothetical protein
MKERMFMTNENLEKMINKLDGDIEALRRAKYYLSNKEEINEIIDGLNKERQIYSDEIYLGDGNAYRECLEVILELVDKELGKDEQSELLEVIKEQYGRKSPNISKKSYGLNAWLKFLDIEYQWIDNEDSEWSTLIITGYTPRI